MMDLFARPRENIQLAPGAFVFRARLNEPDCALLMADITGIAAAAPFRHMQTRMGAMSVAMTNCGPLGWVSDRRGYRYSPTDPESGFAWPALPPRFEQLAAAAAADAGFPGFQPDACLINRYAAGARMGLHQDKDEDDPIAPIVSVSLGLSAVFLWGGLSRSDPVRRLPLESGDVVVWGGPARFTFHGIAPLKPGDHPLTGPFRYNLTFRRVRQATNSSTASATAVALP